MGVPKFFRYISERYPCLSELVKEYQIPEFDNLYLDMNGIIHMCSHPDDNNPHFRITEEKIFKDIFHYIEVLFRMIRPQKLFFMAVDGVAPRAKMNQQRGRRFRSAKDAEKQEITAKKKGEKLPDEARFDSNCITPGTVFMARLHEQLKYFVVNKISNDPMWQKCKIILSGHETPGEGEHKIMDYIRYMRAQPGYDPNTRHCLYGLDADLIMLGLCTHEPHFSLLREEVKFGKKSTKRLSVPEEITFYLLHLSLMREYLELEFAPLKDKLQGFSYDFEKIIDDWVLMGFLVGNDFIPHLPNLHIANGALPILYKAYIDILPTLDGYINEAGTLNLARFEKFMEKLGSIDVENFEEIRDDLLYMESKTGRKATAHPKVSTKNIQEWVPDGKEDKEWVSLEPQITKDSGMLALINQTNEMFLESEEDETELSEEDDAFESFKREYYMNKLEYANVTQEVLRDQAEGYVRAIQWNLNYYYNGCCSWSWYYPHHYAPYISDIKGFSNLNIEFDMGRPFLPYEQLLAVLPSASKNLLPECYHRLMTDEDSLIKKYYPEDFQTDLNGKKQEWEAVVLVPFIDEKVLLEAMESCNNQLTEEEKQRNSHGPMLVHKYTKKSRGQYPAPEYFPDIPENHAEISRLNYDDILIPKEKLVKGAYPGVKMDVYYPGFPTMKHLEYESKLKKAKIRVFESPSRNENMIIKIINKKFPDDKIPLDLLGTTIWVGWPHLVEARVKAISNNKKKYISMGKPNSYNIEEKTDQQIRQFDLEVEGVTEYYRNRMGVDVGETKVLVHVEVMTGRRYVFTPQGRLNMEKIFESNIANYPVQSIVYDIATYDSYHTVFRDIMDVFPVGSNCFTLTNPYYGSQGTVLDSKETLKNGRVKISITVFEQPDLSAVLHMRAKLRKSYKTLYHAASQLSISNHLFSRITGSIFLSVRNGEGGLKNVNVGLDLKFNKKNKETPGFTKKLDNTWLYTDKAVDLVRQYVERYPEIFEYLNKEEKMDEINIESIFKDEWEEKLKELQTWLKSLPSYSVERQTCGGMALELEEVQLIEKIVDEAQKNLSGKKVTMQIKPSFLYKPELQNGTLPPDPNATTTILDRIINVRKGFSVPFGLEGTVISIQETASDTDRDTMFDVVFDKPFCDGMTLNCSEGRGYRLPKSAFINISHGQRLMVAKTGMPSVMIANAESSQRYNRPQQSQPQPWFSQQNVPAHPFAPIPSAHQKEGSAFAQVSCNPAYNKPFNNNGQYNQPSAFQNFYNNGNGRQPRQQAGYKQDQQNFSPQKQQKWQNGGGEAPNRRNFSYSPNVKGNDFMPNFGGGGNRPVAAVQTQQRPQERDHNVELLKTLLNIGRGDKNKTKEIVSKPEDTSQKNVLPQPPPHSSSQDVVKDQEAAQTKFLDMFAEAAKAPASIRLLTYYQSNRLGVPRYQYFSEGNLIRSQITLSNGEFVIGKPAKSKEEASENVAEDILNLFLKKTKNEANPVQAPEQKQGPSRSEDNQDVDSKSQSEGANYNPKSAVLNNSFVPLQAIKRHVAKNNKGANKKVANEGTSKGHAQHQENRDTSGRHNKQNAKGQTGNSHNHSRAPRRTRIAANFEVLKNATEPPNQ